MSPAPIVAQAVLTNYEEVDLIPIYRDPVHDFGFLKFDPSKVKFMELEQIDLCPEKAKVGLEIRVVGQVHTLCLLKQKVLHTMLTLEQQ